MPRKEIVLIAHNIRSTYNVGSLFRTCDGLGINKIYLSGYSPYPMLENDKRLPHIITKTDKAISKTALGAEKTIEWEYCENINLIIIKLRKKGFVITALEQHNNSKMLNTYKFKNKLALVLGNEVDGINEEVLSICDEILEIPMLGKKESFNVAQAAAIALYHLRFYN